MPYTQSISPQNNEANDPFLPRSLPRQQKHRRTFTQIIPCPSSSPPSSPYLSNRHLVANRRASAPRPKPRLSASPAHLIIVPHSPARVHRLQPPPSPASSFVALQSAQSYSAPSTPAKRGHYPSHLFHPNTPSTPRPSSHHRQPSQSEHLLRATLQKDRARASSTSSTIGDENMDPFTLSSSSRSEFSSFDNAMAKRVSTHRVPRSRPSSPSVRPQSPIDKRLLLTRSRSPSPHSRRSSRPYPSTPPMQRSQTSPAGSPISRHTLPNNRSSRTRGQPSLLDGNASQESSVSGYTSGRSMSQQWSYIQSQPPRTSRSQSFTTPPTEDIIRSKLECVLSSCSGSSDAVESVVPDRPRHSRGDSASIVESMVSTHERPHFQAQFQGYYPQHGTTYPSPEYHPFSAPTTPSRNRSPNSSISLHPITPPPSPPFDAKMASLALRDREGYVSFSDVEGLGEPMHLDGDDSEQSEDGRSRWWGLVGKRGVGILFGKAAA